MSKSIIYFDPINHKYIDDFGNKFISNTTLIGKYSNKFEDKAVEIAKSCARIGRNPRHPKYLKYKGKTYKEILASWEKTRIDACDNGNKKHDYLDNNIKFATNFNNIFRAKHLSCDTVQIYTVEDVLENKNFGVVNIDKLKGIKDTYPVIYAFLKTLIDRGFKLYSEIGVFSLKYLISGLIDLLAIKDNKFIIVDWKTNKDDIRFEAGYYEKDNDGNSINYKYTDTRMKPPLFHLADSVGIKYSLQVSMYAYLVEQFGLEYITSIIFQIRKNTYTLDDEEVKKDETLLGKQKVSVVVPLDLREDVKMLISDYDFKRSSGLLKVV